MQHGNGVIDIPVDDEAAVWRRANLSFFQGPVATWTAPDRSCPARCRAREPRLRVYDTRQAVEARRWARCCTCARVWQGAHRAGAHRTGVPSGVLANNPAHLGGAIDTDAADKAARFRAQCSATVYRW